jgi:uncharacterized membrane protein YobD (UPF0266 family)
VALVCGLSGASFEQKGLNMQEILTAVTYLVVWLICQRVIGIESGLTTLLISLSAAFSVYVLYAILSHQMKKRKGGFRE